MEIKIKLQLPIQMCIFIKIKNPVYNTPTESPINAITVAGHQRGDHALADDRDNHSLLLPVLRQRALPEFRWPSRAALTQLVLSSPAHVQVQLFMFGREESFGVKAIE